MVAVELDDETYTLVRLGAALLGLSDTAFIAHAIRALSASGAQVKPEEAAPRRDPWRPLDVYADYDGHHVTGEYLPATRRLTVTSGSLAGQAFTSPSAAARAVIADVNPDRVSTQSNGWRFWKIAGTRKRLDSLR